MAVVGTKAARLTKMTTMKVDLLVYGGVTVCAVTLPSDTRSDMGTIWARYGHDMGFRPDPVTVKDSPRF
jgi:hypothetical protein